MYAGRGKLKGALRHRCNKLTIIIYRMIKEGDILYNANNTNRSRGGRSRRAGERHDFLDGEAKFKTVQRVADADLPLDLCV